MIVRTAAALAALVAFSSVAHAQDIGPALDPTTMIGYAGTVAAGKQAEDYYAKRGYRPETASHRRARNICSNLGWYRRRAAAEKFQRLAATCRRAGF